MKIKIRLADSFIEGIFKLDRVVIGRSNRCDFYCPHEALSRNHCLVELIEEAFYITDLGSSNGVYIDDSRIEPHVRHKYNNYNSLSVGPLECSIEEDADSQVADVNFDISPNDIIKTKISQSPPPVSKKNLRNIKALVPFVILLLAGVFIFNNNQDASSSIDINPVNVRPVKEKKTPSIFKSIALYEAEDRDKSCQGELEKHCMSMKLNPEHEGIFQHKKDVTIYLNTSLYLEETRFKGIKENVDAHELIAMDKILSKSLMNDFFTRSNFQIHLVIKDASNQILKVFRFHPDVYSPATARRMDAIHLLESTIIGASPSSHFWNHLKAYVPEMSVQID